MWDFYWEINKVKMVVNLRRCRASRAKWERDWAAFITRSWEGSEEIDMDAKHCVYDATMPFANVEYLGETAQGVPKSGRGHVRKAAGKGRILLS